MSRSISASTLAILLFFAFFAVFASAAPTNATCGGEVESVPAVTPDPSGVDDSTGPTNTTVIDDGTSDDPDVVDPADVNTLATSATHSGTVRHLRDRRSWFGGS